MLFVYAIPFRQSLLSHLYFDVVKMKLSPAYHVIVIFAAYDPLVGTALTVGFVKSTYALSD